LDYYDLSLQIKYDDGFAAYLNGTLIASRNAPAALAWDSQATASNPKGRAVGFEVITVSQFLSSLRTGTNVLSIQGLNQTATDGDFLLAPRLTRAKLSPQVEQFFSTPTPGASNALVTSDPVFSADSAIIRNDLSLSITVANADAHIYYTLDGSIPTQASLLYT